MNWKFWQRPNNPADEVAETSLQKQKRKLAQTLMGDDELGDALYLHQAFHGADEPSVKEVLKETGIDLGSHVPSETYRESPPWSEDNADLEDIFLDASACCNTAHLTYRDSFSRAEAGPRHSEHPADIPCNAVSSVGTDDNYHVLTLHPCVRPIGHKGPHGRADGRRWNEPHRPKPIIIFDEYEISDADQFDAAMTKLNKKIEDLRLTQRRLTRARRRIERNWPDTSKEDSTEA